MYIYQVQFILILVLISGVCPVMYYIHNPTLEWSNLQWTCASEVVMHAPDSQAIIEKI